MSDQKMYEIEVRIRDREQETTHSYEAPLRHATVDDVAVDIKTVLDSRSGNKVRTIDASR